MSKKASVPKGHICIHCNQAFEFEVRWCPRCEDHQSGMGFYLKKDVCDKCFDGSNDEYLERKKGRAARIAAAMLEASSPERVAAAKAAVDAFVAHTHTDAWRDRFGGPPKPPETAATPENSPSLPWESRQVDPKNGSIPQAPIVRWFEDIYENGEHGVVDSLVEVSSHGPASGEDDYGEKAF